LGLETFPHNDQGDIFSLNDPDKTAGVLPVTGVHGGARRIDGGMSNLVAALAARLPPDTVTLNHQLTTATRNGDGVTLRFLHKGEDVTVEAKWVVLALPPRLAEENILFEPPLDPRLREALGATHTWMAANAKAVIAYPEALWRRMGASGNAFVTHEQAVFAEIFDACDASGAKAALGGFLALSAEQRRQFEVGLPMLMGNQIAQIFGPELEHGEQHYQDWAQDPLTASSLDQTPPPDHPDYGHPLLRRSTWDGALYFAGSETAAYGGGYMEGALDSAKRVVRDLLRKGSDKIAAPDNATDINQHSIETFKSWVASQKESLFHSYRRLLNLGLSRQQRNQLTQRAMLGAMEQVFGTALAELDSLPFDPARVTVEKGRSDLTPKIQAAFDGIMQGLLDNVVEFNRTSCAVCNFPAEHHLSKDYIQVILRDLAGAWAEFSRSANSIFVTVKD
jgi:monoamine oxidase